MRLDVIIPKGTFFQKGEGNMYLDLLVKRVEGNLTLLLQCRNLTGYALATSTGHEAQTVIAQISQRINIVVGGLSQVIEEIRAHKPKRRPETNQQQVDTSELMQFLSVREAADLSQLKGAYHDLNSAPSLIIKLKQRLVDLGLKRQAAGDVRGGAKL